ncbi:MAG: ATP-binding cassette domain-containing protein [Acidobacteriota bacterium]
MGGPVYRLEDVAYAYPSGPGRAAFSLEIDRLEIPEGEILALVGPNGAGKTTLLLLLAFLVRPARGRLEFRGLAPWAASDGAGAARRDAVLVSHHPYLFKGTVADNVAFGLRLRRLPEAETAARRSEALSLVELDGWERKPVSGLSAGQAQRVALARALALRPRALLLDEPTANLDASLGLRMEAVLRDAGRAWGTTAVLSTHDFSQASRLADRILYLSEGRRVEFSHENCFSGTAATDGRTSWIEIKPGLRIVFAGRAQGRVTCVIDPAAIRVTAAGDGGAAAPNVFRGRVSRLETTDAATALVRISGEAVFRAAVPLAEIERDGISLSRDVLLTFDPASVRVFGERPGEAQEPQ